MDLDHRTEIFSLGIVMYEMRVLVRPFDGNATHQIAENIVMREAPGLRKIRPRSVATPSVSIPSGSASNDWTS